MIIKTIIAIALYILALWLMGVLKNKHYNYKDWDGKRKKRDS